MKQPSHKQVAVAFYAPMTSPGVLSLRCPACGRPFLSLPQQAGGLVTCPHCAQSAPMSVFSPAHASAAAVPMQRRVVRQPEMRPSWAPPQPSAYPPAGYAQPAYGMPPASWPPAPESGAAFRPPTAPVVSYPPAPNAEMSWPGVVTPFSVAAPPPPAPPSTSLNSMFGLAEQPWQVLEPAHQPPQAAPVYAPPPPPLPLDYGAMREAPVIEADQLTAWQPPKERSSVLMALLFILGVLGVCGWILKDDLFPPLVAEIPVSGPLKSPAPVAPTSTTAPPVSATPAPAEVEPEIRRAELPKKVIDLVAAGESGQKLFLDLLEAKTPEARAALISQPEEYAADVEEFFAAGKPQLLSFKPSNATPEMLPGHDPVPLFQVVTAANTSGALLRLVPQKDGSFLLDWPLFAETHQRRLGLFLEKKPAEPAWFQVGLRRSHALELPEAIRSTQVAFTLQGAANSSVSCLGVCQKDTPIGRYMNRETEWSSIYVARLLLQHRTLSDGTAAVVILDCEGAATAESR